MSKFCCLDHSNGLSTVNMKMDLLIHKVTRLLDLISTNICFIFLPKIQNTQGFIFDKLALMKENRNQKSVTASFDWGCCNWALEVKQVVNVAAWGVSSMIPLVHKGWWASTLHDSSASKSVKVGE